MTEQRSILFVSDSQLIFMTMRRFYAMTSNSSQSIVCIDPKELWQYSNS